MLSMLHKKYLSSRIFIFFLLCSFLLPHQNHAIPAVVLLPPAAELIIPSVIVCAKTVFAGSVFAGCAYSLFPKFWQRKKCCCCKHHKHETNQSNSSHAKSPTQKSEQKRPIHKAPMSSQVAEASSGDNTRCFCGCGCNFTCGCACGCGCELVKKQDQSEGKKEEKDSGIDKDTSAHNAKLYESFKLELKEEQYTSIMKCTKHGLERLMQRFTAEEADLLINNPDYVVTQSDGATVFIKLCREKYNVIIINMEAGEVVTGLNNISRQALSNLSKNYGWSLPWL